MCGVVIRPIWPTRKQTSETDYLASSVVAHLRLVRVVLLPKKIPVVGAEGWMSMSSTHERRRNCLASAAVQRDVRLMIPDKTVDWLSVSV